jgi:hypothetical protein
VRKRGVEEEKRRRRQSGEATCSGQRANTETHDDSRPTKWPRGVYILSSFAHFNGCYQDVYQFGFDDFVFAINDLILLLGRS